MQVVVHDGQTEAIVDDDTLVNATSIALSPDGRRYYLVGRNGFGTYAQATDSALDVDGDPDNVRDHGTMVVTPF